MDSIIKTFLEKLNSSKDVKKSLTIFVTGIISGIISHLYYMVNMPGSDDIIMINYPAPPKGLGFMFHGASTGRILGGFIDLIQTWYRAFYVSGWITIITMAVMALFIISMFKIKSYAGGIAIATLLQVSPTTQANIVLGEVSYPIAFLFATIAAFCVTRKENSKKQMIRGSVLFGLSLITMPTAMSCYLTLVLLWLIAELADNTEVSTRYLLNRAWKSISVLVILGIMVLILCIGIVVFGGYSMTGYQGAEDALTGGFITHIGANIIQVYKKFIVQGIWKIQIIPKFSITIYIAYLLDILFLGILFKENKNKIDKSRKILAVLGVALLPVAICTITLVGYTFMYKGQHRLPFIFLLAGTVMLAERVAEYDVRRYKKLLMVYLADFIMMMYGFFLFDNNGYQVQAFVMQQDATLCTRILSSLDSREDFSYEKDEVYFLNITSWDKNESVSPIKYDPELYDVIWPVATTNLYCYKDSSIRAHIQNYEGMQLLSPSIDKQEEIENSNLKNKYEKLMSGDFAITKYDGVTVVVVKTVMPPNVLFG